MFCPPAFIPFSPLDGIVYLVTGLKEPPLVRTRLRSWLALLRYVWQESPGTRSIQTSLLLIPFLTTAFRLDTEGPHTHNRRLALSRRAGIRAISAAECMSDPLSHPAVPPLERLSSIDAASPFSEPLSPSMSLSIASRLQTARHLAGLTQQQLAGERYSQRFISALERGKVLPSRETLQALARWLGLPASYFVADLTGGFSQLTERPRLRRTNRARAPLVRQDALLRMLGEAEALLRQRAADAALQALGYPIPPEALSRLHHPRWHWLCGWALGIKRKTQEAIASFQQGLTVAENLQEQVPPPYGAALADIAFRLRCFLAHFANEGGQPQQALIYAQPYVAALEHGLVQNGDLESDIYLLLGEAAFLEGRPRAAITYYDLANQRLIGLHRPLKHLRLQWGLARAYWRDGDLLRAKHAVQQVLAMDLGDRQSLAARVHALLGRILLRLGEQREAEWHLRQGLGGALRSGDPLAQGIACGSYAEFFLAQKDYDPARELIGHGLEAREQLTPQVEGYLRLLLALAYQGDHDQAAERAFQEAIQCFERTTDQFLKGWAHDAFSSFQAEQGRYAEAYHTLRLASSLRYQQSDEPPPSMHT
jgi:transcriptional regulator with XRE-family HTH domain